jgi:hypothetical protein
MFKKANFLYGSTLKATLRIRQANEIADLVLLGFYFIIFAISP